MDKRMFTLLLIVFLDLIGFGIAIPILPILVENQGGGPFLIGLLIAVFSLFQFLSSPILGRLSDKYGRKPLLLISVAFSALSYLLIYIDQSIAMLFFARILAGIGAGNIPVVQAYVADTTKAQERTKKLAMIGAVFGLGFIFGPFLGGFTSSHYSINTPFLLTAILSAVNLPLIVLLLPESNKSLQKHIKIEFFNWKVTKEILYPKNMAFLLFLFFLVNFSLSLIIGVFPVYAQEKFGWEADLVGYYFALIGVGSFITQAFAIRWLLKWFSETQLILTGLLIFAASCILIGFSPIAFLLFVAGPFTSVGFSMLNVNTQSLISLESEENEQGIVMGVAQSFGSLARVIGPIIGGAIASIEIGLPYIVSGIVSIVIFFYGKSYLSKITFASKRT